MNKEQRERFLKLISFLKELEPKAFDFVCLVAARDEQGCGTVCCALGWTPALFPDLVDWEAHKYPDVYRNRPVESGGIEHSADGDDCSSWPKIAEYLFGIPTKVASSLFMPFCQYNISPDLQVCNNDATPQEVAKMLEQYLHLYDEGEV